VEFFLCTKLFYALHFLAFSWSIALKVVVKEGRLRILPRADTDFNPDYGADIPKEIILLWSRIVIWSCNYLASLPRRKVSEEAFSEK
jgi:hypothetical protein